MQRRFNDGDYWNRMKSGEFAEHIIARHACSYPGVLERHPDVEGITGRYRDKDGNDIVEVHYYALPDGSIIPGKRPDPRLLFEHGVMYHMEKARDREKLLAAESATPASGDRAADA